MTESELQYKKKIAISHVKKTGMVLLAFADACRDVGNEKEYQQAVEMYERHNAVLSKPE